MAVDPADLTEGLRRYLTFPQVVALRRLARAALRRGLALYLVGGSVRDVMLGRSVADLDVVVVGGDMDSALLLAQEAQAEVTAHSQLGTCSIRIGDVPIDVASARKESYPHPGALPVVSPASLHEDLARRDFTINAAAVSLMPQDWGRLIDPFGGREDLEAGLIRVLHAGSFVDDATRMLRAARYAGRLEFRLEPVTEALLRRQVRYMSSISGARVRKEVELIFLEDRAADILLLCNTLGLLRAIYPPLMPEDEVLERAREAAQLPSEERVLVLLAMLVYSLTPGEVPGLVQRLAMDSRWAQVASHTALLRDLESRLREDDLSPYRLYRLLSPLHIAAVKGGHLATEDEVVRARLELFLRNLRHARPFLDGDDLLRLGVPQGPMVGLLKEELLRERLEGRLRWRQDEIRYIHRRLEELSQEG